MYCRKHNKELIPILFQGSHELPSDLRQKVQRDGTLVIHPVQKATDAGVYTCSAKNKQGHSARRSGEVAVIGKLCSYCQREQQCGFKVLYHSNRQANRRSC
jgi:hypothetical protein